MVNNRNYALRDTIYELICEGYFQRQILEMLPAKGFTIGKSRLSQIIKELEADEYIRGDIRSSCKLYLPTKKLCPYLNRSSSISRGSRQNQLRIHNISYKCHVLERSTVSNRRDLWDKVTHMKGGVTQYLHNCHDWIDQPLTIQRMQGNHTDTIVIKMPDTYWPYNQLEIFDSHMVEKCAFIQSEIMHRFKMKVDSFIPATKMEYAIVPAPYSELNQAFIQANYTVGELHGDCSTGIPELETTKREKAIAIMEFLDMAESGLLSQGVSELIALKKVGIEPKTMIDVMKIIKEKAVASERENQEKGVVG